MALLVYGTAWPYDESKSVPQAQILNSDYSVEFQENMMMAHGRIKMTLVRTRIAILLIIAIIALYQQLYVVLYATICLNRQNLCIIRGHFK